jgi:hypothetical protein
MAAVYALGANQRANLPLWTQMPKVTATQKAFDQLRRHLKMPRRPSESLISNPDETRLMSEADGLEQWFDGDAVAGVPAPRQPPLLTDKDCVNRVLWVVRTEDVVHARERCVFGEILISGLIKHTNLTGGLPAFSGGELIKLDKRTIVVNGRSGRYGPKTVGELDAAVRAFADSGYGVWSMGWDEDANRPAPFIGTPPQWLS